MFIYKNITIEFIDYLNNNSNNNSSGFSRRRHRRISNEEQHRQKCRCLCRCRYNTNKNGHAVGRGTASKLKFERRGYGDITIIDSCDANNNVDLIDHHCRDREV